MAEHIEWRSAVLRSTRDLAPDIRMFEIEMAGEFVPPTPGSHINITVQIGGRRTCGPIRSSAPARTECIVSW